MNTDIDFYLFTDHDTLRSEQNILVTHTTLPALKERFEQILGFHVSLTYPQKLCDFKPAYGELFADVLREYPYWGYCDCDLVFGDIAKALSLEKNGPCEVFGGLGSLSVFRNDNHLNHLYRQEINGRSRYREVFEEEGICVFDEWWRGPGIHTLFQQEGICVHDIPAADIRIMKQRRGFYYPFFTLDEDLDVEGAREEWASLVYKKGKSLHCFTLWSNDDVSVREIAYAHFQKRPIAVKHTAQNRYAILPNATFDLTPNTLPAAELKRWYAHYRRSASYQDQKTDYEDWRRGRSDLRDSVLKTELSAEAADVLRLRVETLRETKYPCRQTMLNDRVVSRLMVFDDTTVELRKKQIGQLERLRALGLSVPRVLWQTVSGNGSTLEVCVLIDAIPLTTALQKADAVQRSMIHDSLLRFSEKLTRLARETGQRRSLLAEWDRANEHAAAERRPESLGWEQIFVDENFQVVFFSWEKNDCKDN